MTKTLSSKPATTKQLKDTEKRLRQEMRDTAAKLATKTELQDAVQELREEMYTKKDHAKFVKHLFNVFWSKQDMQQYIEATERKAQERHDEYITRMDRTLTEIESLRRDQLFYGNQMMRVEETVADHEKRIHVLEV